MNKETHSEIIVFAVLIGLTVFLIKIAMLLAICALAGLCGFLTVAAIGAWISPTGWGRSSSSRKMRAPSSRAASCFHLGPLLF